MTTKINKIVKYTHPLYQRHYKCPGQILPDGTIKKYIFKDNSLYAEHSVSFDGSYLTKVWRKNKLVKTVSKTVTEFFSLTKIKTQSKTKEILKFEKKPICMN